MVNTNSIVTVLFTTHSVDELIETAFFAGFNADEINRAVSLRDYADSDEE